MAHPPSSSSSLLYQNNGMNNTSLLRRQMDAELSGIKGPPTSIRNNPMPIKGSSSKEILNKRLKERNIVNQNTSKGDSTKILNRRRVQKKDPRTTILRNKLSHSSNVHNHNQHGGLPRTTMLTNNTTNGRFINNTSMISSKSMIATSSRNSKKPNSLLAKLGGAKKKQSNGLRSWANSHSTRFGPSKGGNLMPSNVIAMRKKVPKSAPAIIRKPPMFSQVSRPPILRKRPPIHGIPFKLNDLYNDSDEEFIEDEDDEECSKKAISNLRKVTKYNPNSTKYAQADNQPIFVSNSDTMQREDMRSRLIARREEAIENQKLKQVAKDEEEEEYDYEYLEDDEDLNNFIV